MLAESRRCAYDESFGIKNELDSLVQEIGDESICKELRSIEA